MTKLLCSVFLALVCSAALADAVATNGHDIARLSDKPCTTAKVLAQIPAPQREGWRTASVSMSGQPFTACWHLIPQGVHLLYEDGDQGLIPVSEFHQAPEV